jgi:hypothetical protein
MGRDAFSEYRLSNDSAWWQDAASEQPIYGADPFLPEMSKTLPDTEPAVLVNELDWDSFGPRPDVAGGQQDLDGGIDDWLAPLLNSAGTGVSLDWDTLQSIRWDAA